MRAMPAFLRSICASALFPLFTLLPCAVCSVLAASWHGVRASRSLRFPAIGLSGRGNFGCAGLVSLGLLLLAGPALAAAINDYDGDGLSDLAMYERGTGNWTVLLSSSHYVYAGRAILGGKAWRPVPGNYNGDGIANIAVMSKDGTQWMYPSGGAYHVVNFGVAGAGPVPADYNGDGITDLAYYKKATGQWGILLSGSPAVTVTGTWGGPGFIPAPADFDGDNKTDLCIYQESTGVWYVLLSGIGWQQVGAIWGGPGFEAVPADFDGDGRADLCVYNRTNGEWRVLLSSGAVYGTLGNTAFKPVPGDYDGDGRADPTVYAGSIPDWSMMLSGSGYAGVSLTSGGNNWAAVKSLWQEDLVILAFGDSITYGGGSSSDGPATGYPMLLETKLKQYYDGYFRSINQGHPGEDTYGGFERFAVTLDATNPDLVLLMEGTNDHFYGNDYSEIEENLRNMIRIALARGIPVIIATIPPVITNDYRDRSDQMARIVGFNPRIYQIAADFHIPVAKVFEAITSVPGWQYRLMDQPSANHPNDAGYQVVRDAFYAPITAGLYAGQY